MSKKSREAEARARAAEQRAIALQAELDATRHAEHCHCACHKPAAEWIVMNNSNPVPVAPPADHIQLTPIVQPVPLVPYSSQLQPLAMYIDNEEDDFYYETKSSRFRNKK